MGERQRNSVGTSLRGCIRDIVDRNHPIERVECIVSRTRLATREEVIAYVTAGGVSQKEHMADVAGRLWDNGKIVQPLLDDGVVPAFDTAKLWVVAEKKIPRLF